MAIKPAFALGVGILLVAAGFSPIMTATTSDTIDYVEVDNQTESNVTDTLRVEAVNVNASNSTARVENVRTLNRTSATIDVGSNQTLSIDNEDITVATERTVDNNTTAQYKITHSPTFGFNDQAALLFSNLDTLVALIGFIVVTFSMVIIIT